jgi:hypothetical protein
MKPMYQRKRGLLRIAAIGQVIMMVGAGCKSPPAATQGKNSLNDVSVSQALVGKDGSRSVTAANTVVNGYAALAANVTAGATGITVTDLTDFTTGSRPALAVGDLVLIVQMAGATIDTASNTAAYGAVTDLNNAGRYEFAGVAALPGSNAITLSCALKNSYTAAGKTQVVRVPQYTNLTIESAGSITADAWNGTVGGIVAVHAMNTITVAGTITATGKGFRGGAVHAGSNDTTDVTTYRSADGDEGAMKGEGIAGDPNDVGFTDKYGRGAPANAGGGGNLHNSGGGGGANASAAGTWTGQGVMLTSVTGGTAWTLDPSAGANSPGGGRGGYSYSNSNQDALTLAPGQAAWTGSDRRERGGLGGRPLPSGTESRLFMGGGGGAGDQNNTQPVAGGNGGGMVFLIAGTVTGEGTISANGADGGDSGSATTTTQADGAGGGGGGGTIVVHAGVLSLVHVTANGGHGGDQAFGATGGTEAEGPGGGGGGGFIALSGGTPASATADGALGGTTNSSALTEFPSNGATAGHTGVVKTDETTLLYCTDHAAPTAIIITKPSDPSNSGSGTFTFGSVEANNGVDAGDSAASFACSLDGAAFGPCPPTYVVSGLADGWHTMDVKVVDLSGNDAGAGSQAHYRWRVDLNAPVPWILSGPGGTTSGGTSNSSTATFTFNATERDAGTDEVISFLCRLDSSTATFTPCNAADATSPTATFTGLTEGTHTLDVKARDNASDAGNVSATVTWTWHVEFTDGGTDAGDAGDAAAVDAGEAGDALGLTDADDTDAHSDSAGVVVLDGGSDARDTNTTIDASVMDTATLKDASIAKQDAASTGDADDSETGYALLDAKSDATRSDGANPSDGGSTDAGPARDAAPDTAVNSPDASIVPPKADAAPPTPKTEDYKFMGGGFCSMNPSGSGAPGLATLFLVAAFGLLVVRRRR